MEQGFSIADGYGNKGPSHWVKGAPKESAVWGVMYEVQPIPIGSFRCTACGYLETYARFEFATKGT